MPQNIWIITDYIGRQLIGEVVKEHLDIIVFANPIIIQELVKDNTIDVQFRTISSISQVDMLETYWSSRYQASEPVIQAYEEFLLKLRAARVGIQMATSVPNNLIQLTKKPI